MQLCLNHFRDAPPVCQTGELVGIGHARQFIHRELGNLEMVLVIGKKIESRDKGRRYQSTMGTTGAFKVVACEA